MQEGEIYIQNPGARLAQAKHIRITKPAREGGYWWATDLDTGSELKFDEETINEFYNLQNNSKAMITVENIVNEYPKISQDNLPEPLKASEFEFIKENIDLYNDDETIKKYIDTFVEKLNELESKGKKNVKAKPAFKEKDDDEPPKLTISDIPAIVKKFMPKFQQQAIIGSEEHFEIVKRLEKEIKAIPKNIREADKAYEKAKKKGKVNYTDFYPIYAHFFYGGSDWFVLSWDGDEILFCYVVLNGDTQMSEMGDVSLTELHENRVELDFFWDVKPLSKALYNAYPDEFPKPGIKPEPEREIKEEHKEVKPKEDSPEKSEPEPLPVEKVGIEVSFIKRYVGLHGKIKDKQQILNLLNSLQKAIIEKRIRKTSPYAKEIGNIQAQLIKCYEQMGNTIQVNIDEKTLEAYSSIAHSEKTMLSVAYIKQYISIHGKQGVKEKAKILYEKIEKALEIGKIPESCPYWNEIKEIKTSLKSYIGGNAKAPVINESTLNGIMSWIKKRQQKKKVAKYLQKIYETEKGLRGVDEAKVAEKDSYKSSRIISSIDLAKMEFKTMGFTGKWKELIGDPSERFLLMLYGSPGSGKSTLALEFAYYLAKNHNSRVLYVVNEEKVGLIIQDRQKRLNAIHPNLNYTTFLTDEDLKNTDVVFIDSVNTHGLTPGYIETITSKYPKLSVVYICQTTKSGKFRGSQEWEHLADVVIKTEDGVARSGKNRFGGHGEIKIDIAVQP